MKSPANRSSHLLVGLDGTNIGRVAGPLLAEAIGRLVPQNVLRVVINPQNPLAVAGELDGMKSLIVMDEVDGGGAPDEIQVLEWDPSSSGGSIEHLLSTLAGMESWGGGIWHFLRITSVLAPIPRLILLGVPSFTSRWGGQSSLQVAMVFPFLLRNCIQILNGKLGISIENWAGGPLPAKDWELLIEPPCEVYPR